MKKSSNVIVPLFTNFAPSEIRAAIAKKNTALVMAYKTLRKCSRVRDDL
jgi:hypothetical protein